MGLGGRRSSFTQRKSRRGPRVGRRLLVALVGLVLLVGLVKLYGPLAAARRKQEELTRLGLEKATLAAEQERLQSYKRHLASEAGLEGAARREGYVRDGERRLVFIPRANREPASPTRAAGMRTRGVQGSPKSKRPATAR